MSNHDNSQNILSIKGHPSVTRVSLLYNLNFTFTVIRMRSLINPVTYFASPAMSFDSQQGLDTTYETYTMFVAEDNAYSFLAFLCKRALARSPAPISVPSLYMIRPGKRSQNPLGRIHKRRRSGSELCPMEHQVQKYSCVQ